MGIPFPFKSKTFTVSSKLELSSLTSEVSIPEIGIFVNCVFFFPIPTNKKRKRKRKRQEYVYTGLVYTLIFSKSRGCGRITGRTRHSGRYEVALPR